jgi:peptide/bleomycin uptake transporter
VFGEDDSNRAAPPSLTKLYADVRQNYFRMYLNYMYFNVGRILYLQTDSIFPYIVLAPTIVAGKITLGPMNQILNAFSQVRSSLQYLVNSWSQIVELISIYKRLSAFEGRISEVPATLLDAARRSSPAAPLALNVERARIIGSTGERVQIWDEADQVGRNADQDAVLETD